MSRKVTLICDLQFGSTGKGLIAGFLSKVLKPDVVVTAWGANAGHTFIDENGQKFVSTMVANSIVSYPDVVLLAPGSIINPENLKLELEMYKRVLGTLPPLLIHENATVINESHRETEEKTMVGIGSTRKGVGAAIIQKIARDPNNLNVAKEALKGTAFHQNVITASEYENFIENAKHVFVEGAQGFDLGINSGFYPYVTSRECTPAQILSDCCIPISDLKKVIGVMRTFPIRVSNRYNAQGEMIGFSGPGYPDQKEITWEEVGVPPEQTTVTKLNRRVFSWSTEQCARAIRQCAPDEIFLNFCNYVDTVDGFHDGRPMSTELQRRVDDIKNAGGKLRYLGFGPSALDIIDLGVN